MSYTDLHEKSVELAGSQGLLKYLTLDFLPKVMADDPPESVSKPFSYQGAIALVNIALHWVS